jgi:hypothetical protein
MAFIGLPWGRASAPRPYQGRVFVSFPRSALGNESLTLEWMDPGSHGPENIFFGSLDFVVSVFFYSLLYLGAAANVAHS